MAVDSLKLDMSCQSLGLEDWRELVGEGMCVFSSGMSSEPALSDSTSGGDMLPQDLACA